MAIPKSVLAAAVVATFAVPGCAAPNQATYSCTPEAGGEPYACVKEQYDLMVERNKSYAEAEAVYRKFFAEDDRIFRAGGADEVTPVIDETTTGAFREGSRNLYRGVKHAGTRLVGGESKIVYTKKAPTAQEPGMSVAMEFCTDAHSAILTTPGVPNASAGYLGGTLQFTQVEQRIKIGNSHTDVVSSC